ncbi:MAG: VPLPA-CTERM sorting domain-containing protein [Pseudomonadota bacterium]
MTRAMHAIAALLAWATQCHAATLTTLDGQTFAFDDTQFATGVTADNLSNPPDPSRAADGDLATGAFVSDNGVFRFDFSTNPIVNGPGLDVIIIANPYPAFSTPFANVSSSVFPTRNVSRVGALTGFNGLAGARGIYGADLDDFNTGRRTEFTTFSVRSSSSRGLTIREVIALNTVNNQVALVPVPASLLLLVSALGVLFGVRRRYRSE